MKNLGLLSLAIIALIGLSQPAHGDPSDRSEDYYYPRDSVYESFGRGNFCYETRVAVRRYQRDKGLAMTGKIDSTLLKALGLR